VRVRYAAAHRSDPEVHHLIITCNADGELAARARGLRSAHLLILPDAVNDRGFAMTSSFSSMLLAAAQSATALLSQARPLAERLVAREFRRVVYLGSNELRGLAREAALKLLELTDGWSRLPSRRWVSVMARKPSLTARLWLSS
jgi:tagatose-6-phosphate ketose/aldose isomerase